MMRGDVRSVIVWRDETVHARGFPMRKVLPLLAIGLLVAACSLMPGSGGLTGKVWQWTAMTEQVPASQSVVPDPQNYTLEFKGDGTYSVKADCNQGSGTYTTSGSSLTLVSGPMTLAACPPESSSDIYLSRLALTSSYEINDESQLVLTQSDGGTMTFD
jgi:heat shock protein HslJ